MVHERQRTPRPPSGQDSAAYDPLDGRGEDVSDSAQDGGGERVAKALARAGVASRREVERLIEAGRVALNGQALTTPAVRVEPGDILTVDGEVVDEREPARLFRYHKPAGLVTSHADPQGRPTVFQALPEGLPRLISVGRLDLNTEGLLLLTNDGELARALELPATGLQRRYRARAHGRITQDRLDRLKDGVTVEGVRYGPIEAKIDKAREGAQGANVWISLTLSEGKNREVRRVLESLGLKVNRLIRLSYGPLALGALEAGELEEVGPRVLREQFADFIAPENMPKGERPAYAPPRRKRTPGAARRAEPTDALVEPPKEAPAKKVYEPGWAKPKAPDRPARPARAKTKTKALARPGEGAERTPSAPPRGAVRSTAGRAGKAKGPALLGRSEVQEARSGAARTKPGAKGPGAGPAKPRAGAPQRSSGGRSGPKGPPKGPPKGSPRRG
ncbi:MAG: pseudouridine synthase [Caulobacteraceae bacterium]|nr:pseudouridine synthase [Caulobacteraceae bacterium]